MNSHLKGLTVVSQWADIDIRTPLMGLMWWKVTALRQADVTDSQFYIWHIMAKSPGDFLDSLNSLRRTILLMALRVGVVSRTGLR